MGNYATEQGGDHQQDDRPLSADLKAGLREMWGLDVFVSEFPYHQYAGVDFPVEAWDKSRSWLENDWVDGDPRTWADSVKQRGPFRTDLVGVDVDRRALRLRISRVGHATPLNQPGQGKRRYRRTFLTFMGDGPMRREYWEKGHGSHDWDREHGPDRELRSYGEDSASRAFGWLKKRKFLRPVGSKLWDAVEIPLHIHGRAHAFELKLEPGEWATALKQASRADVYADYRWVVYDRATAPTQPDQLESFQDNGIGLITVSPHAGVEIEVWAEQCTPEVDRDLLDRYMVERWDLNERVLSALESAHEYYTEYTDERRDKFMEPEAPDILGDIDPDSVETDLEPPTVHGFTAGRAEAAGSVEVDPNHTPLTAFGGDGEDV